MKPIGVPTLLAHLRLSGAIGDLRRQSEAARSEVVTGRIADLPKALGRSVGEAQLLRKAVDDIALRKEGIALANLRANVAQRMLGDIGSGAAALNADMTAAIGRGDEKAIAVAAEQARGALETAFARINARIEGKAVFAGDAAGGAALGSMATLLADVAAIYTGAADPAQLEADLDFYFNDPAGGFATTIYQGGSGDLASIEIADGERVNAAARADEAPIRDLLRGLALAATAGAAPPSALRDAALASAGANMLTGADGVIDIRTRIGVEQQQTEAASTRLENEETAMTEAYNAATSRDPYEAASRLQALESQLNASYLVTARLSQLTLANYLR
jgi:flagellar hook-associated protein 3 FlgL